MQLNLDFNTPQNSAENQQLYGGNKHSFGEQCRKIYEHLMQGNRCTGRELERELDIGDARARIRDLRKGGIRIDDVKKTVNRSTYKIYFIEQ